MARVKKSDILLSGLRGKIGNTLVIKQYAYGTVVTKYPDMSGVKWSQRQKGGHKKFKEAVAFAKAILKDEKKRKQYEKKLKKGQSVYHKVISEYMRGN